MIATIKYHLQHSTVFSKINASVPLQQYEGIPLTQEEKQIASQMSYSYKLPQTITYKLSSTRMGFIQSLNIKWPQSLDKITNTYQLMKALISEGSYPESLAIAIVFEHFEIENSPFLPSSQLQLKNRLSAVACPDLPSLLYFIRRIHFESGESEFDIDKYLNKRNMVFYADGI